MGAKDILDVNRASVVVARARGAQQHVFFGELLHDFGRQIVARNDSPVSVLGSFSATIFLRRRSLASPFALFSPFAQQIRNSENATRMLRAGTSWNDVLCDAEFNVDIFAVMNNNSSN